MPNKIMETSPQIAARMEVTLSDDVVRVDEAAATRVELIRNMKHPRPSKEQRTTGDVSAFGKLSHSPVRCKNKSITMYINEVQTINTKKAYLGNMKPLGILGSRIPAPNTKKN